MAGRSTQPAEVNPPCTAKTTSATPGEHISAATRRPSAAAVAGVGPAVTAEHIRAGGRHGHAPARWDRPCRQSCRSTPGIGLPHSNHWRHIVLPRPRLPTPRWEDRPSMAGAAHRVGRLRHGDSHPADCRRGHLPAGHGQQRPGHNLRTSEHGRIWEEQGAIQ